MNMFQQSYHGTGASAERGYSVLQTADGGYICAGTVNGFGLGNMDMYLIRTDSLGNVVWAKTYGQSGYDISGLVIIQAKSGEFVITGATGSFGAGSNDVYLVKIDLNGNILWSKTFGGSNTDEAYSVLEAADGGYVMAGVTESFGAGDGDAYLLKTDSNGNLQWTKTFGGPVYEVVSSVVQTKNGGYVIAGLTSSFGAGSYDVYLVCTDSIGDTLWTKTFGGSSSDQGIFIQSTKDTGYAVVASTLSFGAGKEDIYLIKTDKNGSLQWSKTFGGINYDDAHWIVQISSGALIIAGTSLVGPGNYEMSLIKTDAGGNLIWSKAYGGAAIDFGYSVCKTTDKGYIMSGYTNSFGPWGEDVYLVKTDSSGNSNCNQTSLVVSTSSPVTLEGATVSMVSAGGIVTSPVSLSTNGGTAKDLCSTVNTIEHGSSSGLVPVFPNPGRGLFMINNAGAKIVSVDVYDLLGEKIAIFEKKEIDIQKYPNGIYFYNVHFENGGYAAGKLIKE